MKTKITLFLALLTSTICSYAQVSATLQHNNLANGAQYDGEGDMAFYNNEMYFTIPSAGKIVKVNLAVTNSLAVDVVTGLSNPTGLSFVGNELYFLQLANAGLAPSTGKLSKIDATLPTPTVSDLFTGLMYPVEIETNGTNVYLTEAYLDGMGDLDHMEITLINLAGAPTKTVLYNNFYSLDDFEFKDNFLYLIEWPGGALSTKIYKLDVTSGTPSTPTLFYTDAVNDAPYNGIIKGNYLYLNHDGTPGKITRLDLTLPTPSPELVVTGFTFGPNNAYVNEMDFDSGNTIYALGDYFDGVNITYLLYKADLSTLGIEDNSFNSKQIAISPNPTSDYLEVSNLEIETNYTIYGVDGKLALSGKTISGERINISKLNTGIYLLSLKDGNTFKFIKE
ncbi:MAG: T9SS type A sorting domain-containing protein [Bacteroidota bacterium]